MKRFLIFLGVILGVTALGFGTYFLVRNNETFTVQQTSIYLAEGDDFEIDYEWNDKKTGSTFSVEIGDDSILKHLPEKAESGKERFTAQAGGHTTILFAPSNSKIENIIVNIYVGDGSILSPYYISTPEQLQSIQDSGGAHLFTLDKFYKQINDIDMAGVNFTPIGAGITKGFTGEYDGGGYEISNLLINNESFNETTRYPNAGMFDSIGENGRVVDLKLDNVVIQTDKEMGRVGTVAGESYGEIERVEIISTTISVPTAHVIGGVVGWLESSESGRDENYTRHAAEIDRVGVNQLTLGVDIEQNISGVSGAVGGLVGGASGGVIVYSYAKGEVYLNSEGPIEYGGLVGYSEYVDYKNTPTEEDKYTHLREGIRIRDSYSSIKLNLSKYIIDALQKAEDDTDIFERAYIGGTIGWLYDDFLMQDSDLLAGMFKIFGTYYNKTAHENEGELIFSVDGEGAQNNYSSVKEQLDLTTAIGYYSMNNEAISKSKKDPNIYDITGEKEDIYFPHNYRSFAYGLSEQEFSEEENFLSHYVHDRIYDENGLVDFETTKVFWNFENPWNLSLGVNGGYPYLNYENILLSNSVEVVNKQEIRNYNDLQNMTLDGHYVIIKDIYMPTNPNKDLNPGDEGYNDNSSWTPWIPIGTESSPFTGSLQSAYEVKDGEKRRFAIKGLLVNPELSPTEVRDRTYGGLFGVTSGRHGGYIKNLVIEQADVSGYITAGALVASNGYEYLNSLTRKRVVHKGLEISNISIVSSNVEALEYAGGAIGRNYGVVRGITVTEGLETNEETGLEISAGVSTVKLAEDTKMRAVGGISGYNDGVIERSFVLGSTEISAEHSASQVRVGGIAGLNTGKIYQSAVYGQTSIRGSVERRDSEDGSVSSATAGFFGGIAGAVSEGGLITESFVKETVISADTKDNTVFVGGIAGSLTKNGAITNSSVNAAALTGYAVGGVVGEMNIEQNINYKFEASGRITTTDNKISMSVVEVKNGTVLTGSKVGGLISVMKNGIVSQALVRETTLNGSDKSSVKAGLVVDLPRVIVDGIAKAGVIQEVYVATTFGKEGKSFAMSQSEFLQTPIVKGLPFTDVRFEKPHGFVVNYLFDKTISEKANHPKTSNVNTIKNWFSKATHWLNNVIDWFPTYGEQSPTTTADMYDHNSYKAFNFAENYVWEYSEDKSSYPELKELIDLEDKLITNSVSILTLTTHDFSFNVLTPRLGKPIKTSYNDMLVSSYKVENGGSFSFEIEFGPNTSPEDINIVVKVNNVVLRPTQRGAYNIDGIFEAKNIVIEQIN